MPGGRSRDNPLAVSATLYAGFWARVLARFIDNLVLWVAAWIVQLMFFGASYWLKRLGTEDASLVQLTGAILFLGIDFTYFVAAHRRYGTTIGKRALGIYVIDFGTGARISLGQSIGRYVATWLSSVVLGIGFLVAAFHPQKRALHDLLAGTACVYRR